MKKLFTLFLFFSYFSIFSQCSVSTFDLNLIHKDINFVENFVFSDIYSSDYKKNFGWKNYNSSRTFDYLDGSYNQDNIEFNYQNKFLDRNTKYFIKIIDAKVYKIEITINYSEYELNEFERDYLKIKNCITKFYKIKSSTGVISNKFQESKNSELITRNTGTYDSFDRTKIQNSQIFKVNDFTITKKKNYKPNLSEGLIGYSNNLENYSIILDFVNLNGTPLDNRGY